MCISNYFNSSRKIFFNLQYLKELIFLYINFCILFLKLILQKYSINIYSVVKIISISKIIFKEKKIGNLSLKRFCYFTLNIFLYTTFIKHKLLLKSKLGEFFCKIIFRHRTSCCIFEFYNK